MSDSIDVIIDVSGTIPLIKRGHEPFKNCWALPGGRINPNERLLQTVVRELGEELGIKLEIMGRNRQHYSVKIGQFEGKLTKLKRYKSVKDPRGGYTTVYALEISCAPEELGRILRNGDDAIGVRMCHYCKLPELAFMHNLYIEDYFSKKGVDICKGDDHENGQSAAC